MLGIRVGKREDDLRRVGRGPDYPFTGSRGHLGNYPILTVFRVLGIQIKN